jgi:hypothetical protein
MLVVIAVTLVGRTSAQQVDWPRRAAANQQFGVYGWLHAAALEPDPQRAERLRLCGSFVTPASSAEDVLRGCLLFSRQDGAAEVLAEWQELVQLAIGGAPMTNAVGGAIRGIVGFGAIGLRPRVRTSLDTDVAADAYVMGAQAALVTYDLAPKALGLTPKPPHTVNFALVERVTLESRSEGNRLRVDGVFTLQQARAAPAVFTAYQEPQRGYLYLSGRLDEVQAWSSLAGSNRVARFFVFGNAGSVRVRPPEEAPTSPDRLVDWGRLEPRVVANGLDYGPVRRLAALR